MLLRRARQLATSSLRPPPWERVALVGESALLLRFGTTIDLEVNKRVIHCLAALDRAPQLAGVKDMLPAYASLLVHFDPLAVSSAEVEHWCAEAAAAAHRGADDEARRVVTIPVRYGGEHGPDIDEAARIAGLGSAEEVARLHAGGDYRVFFLGFTGGFPYLGGLPEELKVVPRLPTPRQAVPRGAVGIAAGQTGVYTIDSPGGWHLLGRTAKALFDPSRCWVHKVAPGEIARRVAPGEIARRVAPGEKAWHLSAVSVAGPLRLAPSEPATLAAQVSRPARFAPRR